jgi:hypothetical protein
MRRYKIKSITLMAFSSVAYVIRRRLILRRI